MKPEYDCQMLKKWSTLLAFTMMCVAVYPQSNSRDSVITPIKENLPSDTTLDYESLFQDFDAFMDSILSPHSYFLGSLSVGKGYFNFDFEYLSLLQNAIAGKTMVELAPRARFGVSVLAVQKSGSDEDGFIPISPDRKLDAGDTIMAAGRPSDLRRFIRELEGM